MQSTDGKNSRNACSLLATLTMKVRRSRKRVTVWLDMLQLPNHPNNLSRRDIYSLTIFGAAYSYLVAGFGAMLVGLPVSYSIALWFLSTILCLLGLGLTQRWL